MFRARIVQPLYGTGPLGLFWNGSWAECGQIAVNGSPNTRNYYAIFVVYTKFTAGPSGRAVLGVNLRPMVY